MDDLKGKCRGCDKGAICRGGCKQLSYFVTGNMCESLYCNYRWKKFKASLVYWLKLAGVFRAFANFFISTHRSFYLLLRNSWWVLRSTAQERKSRLWFHHFPFWCYFALCHVAQVWYYIAAGIPFEFGAESGCCKRLSACLHFEHLSSPARIYTLRFEFVRFHFQHYFLLEKY